MSVVSVVSVVSVGEVGIGFGCGAGLLVVRDVVVGVQVAAEVGEVLQPDVQVDVWLFAAFGGPVAGGEVAVEDVPEGVGSALGGTAIV
ncbi:hypothetical protein [Rhodococcus sp. 1R11]|uniref:hypothetical protein n=1 Tax=Rhodococcus sp. 1R11 TaxID=2559614 RepID=UPI001FD6EB3B|nr:hypothetical protein [Rhodococcus sp. 1R11]